MPLDPEVKRLLDEMAAAGEPSIHQLTPEQARAQMRKASEAIGEVEPVQLIEDRSAAGPCGPIPVRVYRPADGELPLVVYFHGGGWVIGGIDTHDCYCRSLANAAQAVVVSVDYRLAPEHPYPAAFEDALAATEWAAANASRLGADLQRLVVAGDSAGGNLAAAVALAAGQTGRPQLALQVLIYPIVDYDLNTPSYAANADGYILTRDTMSWFWDHYLASRQDARQPQASPLRAAELTGLPPALVITAEYDPLLDEGEAYARRLMAAGVETTLTRYDGMVHGFVRHTERLESARAALTQVARAIRAQ